MKKIKTTTGTATCKGWTDQKLVKKLNWVERFNQLTKNL